MSCDCGRRPAAGRRSSPTRCGSSPSATSSTGSRIPSPTTWPAWSFPNRPAHCRSRSTSWPRWPSVNPFDFFLDPDAERYPFSYDPALARDLAPYLTTGDPGRLLRQWLAEVEVPAGGEATVDFLVGVNQRVQAAVAYTTRFEPGVQTAEQTLEKGLGSCRDSAWLLTQILRGLGLAARFVSGYLVQLKADETPLEGAAGPSADFTDLHAWSEVYVPGAGWVGLDPTSGLFAGEGHLPLACTPDPASAAPVSGEIEPCDVTLEYANVVRRVSEDPRVTFPYTDAQWAGIDALGRSVDARLEQGDVRLTHGGEPTFVSVDGTEAPEWSTAADGTQKRAMAWALTRRLAERFSSGGVVHHGPGQVVPGRGAAPLADGCRLAHRRGAAVVRLDAPGRAVDCGPGVGGGRPAPGPGRGRPTRHRSRLLHPRLRGRHAPIVDRGSAAGRRGGPRRRRPDRSGTGGIGQQATHRGRPGCRVG